MRSFFGREMTEKGLKTLDQVPKEFLHTDASAFHLSSATNKNFHTNIEVLSNKSASDVCHP